MTDVLQPAFDKCFEEDWKSFHDVLMEVVFVNGVETRFFGKEECKKAFDLLPRNIKIEAIEWGLGDTVVRDSAYVYLKNINWKP